MNGSERDFGCHQGCGCDDTSEKVVIASILTRLGSVERQANATDVKVARIARDVNPEEWEDKLNAVKRSVQDEEDSRIDADSAIRNDLLREVTERKGRETIVDDAIAAEKAAREAADSSLSSSIATESEARAAVNVRVSEEITNRSEADALLGQSVSSLAAIVDTDRSTLSSAIEDVRADANTKLENEATERFLRDKEIRDSVSEEVVRAKAAELEEAQIRLAADSAESETRTTEVSRLDGRISDEVARREETDRKILSETSERKAADLRLEDLIATEKDERTDADGTVLQQAKDYADIVSAKVFRWMGSVATYTELLSITDAKYGDVYRVDDENTNYVYSPGRGSESGQVWVKFSETIDLTPYALKTEVAAEKQRAETKEAELGTRITESVSELDGKISAERERAVLAETSNASAISAEVAKRELLDTTLRGLIEQGYSIFDSAIQTETSERKAADQQEKTARESADTAIRTDFAAADTALGSRIDAADSRITSEKADVLATLDTTAQTLDAKVQLERETRENEIGSLRAAIGTENEERTNADAETNGRVNELDTRMTEAERKIEELGGDTVDKLLDVPFVRKVKIADYLYALDYHMTYPKEAKEFFDTEFPAPFGGCSSFRNGRWYVRNYDWLYDESAEFIVRMAANKDRHGSIGVAAAPMTHITDAMIKSGAYLKVMKVIPHMLLDGVNDAGVFANLNVVHRSGHEASDWIGRDCCALGAIREILDRFDNAEDAAHWVEHSVYIPVSFIDKTKCSFHFMIGDSEGTWIVEDGKAHKLRESDAVAMTNFRLFNDTAYTDGVRANIAAYDPYGAGVERYNLIKNGLAGVTDKDSAAELAKSIWYTRAYPSHPNPPTDFWYSEFVNEDEGYSLSTPDATLRAYADRFDPYYQSGKRDGTIWKSLHSCVYDLTEKVLRVRVQEIDREFEFGIVDRNASSGASLDGKTYLRPTNAKGWYDLLVTVIQDLGGNVVDA